MKKLLLLLLLAGFTRAARADLKTDIEYGRAGGESLKLDAYVPDGAGPFPAVILVHGGGWNAGDKSGGPKKGYMAPLHEPLQKAGFAWFSINYRLAPKHPYPACIEDVETAIRWVKANAAKYHLDPQRIALSGESAGGHLVELAAVRADESTRMAAIVPFYGRGELLGDLKPGAAMRVNYVQLFGRKTFDETAQRVMTEASPLLHLKAGLPPVLLVHGTADQSVPYEQSVEWQKRSRAFGLTCDLITIKDGVHGMISWDAVAPNYKQEVVAWLQRTLKIEPAKTSR
jgi:alpha-L-fucosidase 2